MQDVTRPEAITIGGKSASTRVKSAVKTTTRLVSIDVVRGYAMLMMLLSHAAHEIPGVDYRAAYRWTEHSPVQMNTLQDWIGLVIGVAAPAFFLLLGLGLALFHASRRRREWTEAEITRFMVTRGLLFIAIEQLLLNWQLPVMHYHPYFGVLSAMGITVVMMAFLRLLSRRSILLLTVITTLSVQAYYYFAGQPETWSFVRSLFLAMSPVDTVEATFPVLGWLPFVLIGFYCGQLLSEKRVNMRRLALTMGCGLFCVFLVVRFAGGFGNLYMGHPLALTKVPPDLAYISFYASMTFFMLYVHTFFTSGMFINVLTLFGQTALFFFVLHEEYVLNLSSRALSSLPFDPMLLSLINAVIATTLLYFLCIRYRDLRRKYPDSVLKYF